MRQALLIYNPTSGRHAALSHLSRVEAALARSGFAVRPRPTEGPDHATELAREAVRGAEIEVVFAMGGDGTLREAAAGLLGSPVALGLLPAGTTNVLALALCIPRRPLAAARAAAAFAPRTIDIGLCGDQPFLMMASAGLDAAVMAGQSPGLKKRFGRAAIAASGLRHWWGYAYLEHRLATPSGERRASFFACCNIPQYGGPFRMAPQADPADGRLDLVLFRGRGRWATLGFARDLILGRHLRRADVETARVEGVELLGEGRAQLQIDGDVRSFELPVWIRLRPAGLTVLAPPL